MVELLPETDSVADLNAEADFVSRGAAMMPPSEPGCQTGVLDSFGASS
jgi:hypothetical protein